MRKDDIIRLRHMMDASKEALSFAEGRSRADLDKNRMLVLSLVKEIEIIGEAAGKVSQEARDELTSIPWFDIISMRNRLIHAYFEVDLDIVWDTLSKDLPSLLAELEKVVQFEE